MLTEFMNKKVTELSGGMKRKLSLAMAIVTKPKIVPDDRGEARLLKTIQCFFRSDWTCNPKFDYGFIWA